MASRVSTFLFGTRTENSPSKAHSHSLYCLPVPSSFSLTCLGFSLFAKRKKDRDRDSAVAPQHGTFRTRELENTPYILYLLWNIYNRTYHVLSQTMATQVVAPPNSHLLVRRYLNSYTLGREKAATPFLCFLLAPEVRSIVLGMQRASQAPLPRQGDAGLDGEREQLKS